jgi:hypothetical protein
VRGGRRALAGPRDAADDDLLGVRRRLLPARAGGRTAYDAFLLNDPLLQRTGPLPPAARAEIVHERRPDVVVLASRRPDRLVPAYPTDAALARHPAMAAYRLAHTGSGGTGCGYHLLAYRR